MNTLHLVAANGGDGWGIEDSTPPRRWYFRRNREAHEYAQAHGCVIDYYGERDFAALEGRLFGEVLPLDDGPNWPLWDKGEDETYQEMADPFGDDPGYDPDEDIEGLARNEDGSLIDSRRPMTGADIPDVMKT